MVNPSYIQKYEVNNLRTVLQLFIAGWQRIVFKIQLNSSNPRKKLFFKLKFKRPEVFYGLDCKPDTWPNCLMSRFELVTYDRKSPLRPIAKI